MDRWVTPAAVVRPQDVMRSTLALSVTGLTAIALSTVDVPPRLVWNTSPSLPIGAYWLEHGALSSGDVVAVKLPQEIANLAADRRYLPRSALLLKTVAAIPGTHVCKLGQRIVIERRRVDFAGRYDLGGRPMPRWSGCRRLASRELFLIGRDPQSFDSRYFGPILVNHVVGRARPIWTWPVNGVTSPSQ